MGAALALCLLGALLLASAPAYAANTCPGRNGSVAVVSYPGEEAGAIGVLGPNRRLQELYEGTGKNDALFDLSFSCNGKQIVYTEDNGSDCLHLGIFNLAADKPRLYRMPGGWTTQFPTPHLCAGSAAFLSSGTIVFSASSGERGAGTYVVHPNGSHLRRLFRRQEIAASPDGRWFVATTHSKLYSLSLLDAKGRAVRRLVGPAPTSNTEYSDPHFSPDGKWIVYEERHFLGVRIHDILYMVRRDGTHRRRLTFGPESASEPVFSPDGRWIAFTRSKSGPGGYLFALSVKHPSRTKRLSLSSGYQYPAWGAR